MSESRERTPLRVLVVDESPISRRVLDRLLSFEGYCCCSTLDANEATTIVASFKPHAVIFDWAFRSGVGVGLASRLREAAVCSERDLLVVVLSVLDEPPGFRDRERVDHYFVKPASLPAISEMIRWHFKADTQPFGG